MTSLFPGSHLFLFEWKNRSLSPRPFRHIFKSFDILQEAEVSKQKQFKPPKNRKPRGLGFVWLFLRRIKEVENQGQRRKCQMILLPWNKKRRDPGEQNVTLDL